MPPSAMLMFVDALASLAMHRTCFDQKSLQLCPHSLRLELHRRRGNGHAASGGVV